MTLTAKERRVLTVVFDMAIRSQADLVDGMFDADPNRKSEERWLRDFIALRAKMGLAPPTKEQE